MRYFIEDTTLTGIADAVRGKNGTTEPIAVKDLASAITNLPSGGGEVEIFILKGDASYGCAGKGIVPFVQYIQTEQLTNGKYMFYNYDGETIPFDLNFIATNQFVDVNRLFYNATKLTSLPKVYNLNPSDMESMFYGCQNLTELPVGFADSWAWTGLISGKQNGLFYNCYRLRKIDMDFLAHGRANAAYSGSIYYQLFYNCYLLDEVVGLPFPHTASWTSNAFNSTVASCHRLSRFTFATQADGSPYVMPWKGQTLDLSGGTSSMAGIGFHYDLTTYGLPSDKKVSTDSKYQALKNDPDWWASTVEYARYNHDSAVETINSLPDCSATGTNTIKFKGANGSATDGGAINTLTEEEIAVAAAKGWTVSLV